jgi:hypothetical protein
MIRMTIMDVMVVMLIPLTSGCIAMMSLMRHAQTIKLEDTIPDLNALTTSSAETVLHIRAAGSQTSTMCTELMSTVTSHRPPTLSLKTSKPS